MTEAGLLCIAQQGGGGPAISIGVALCRAAVSDRSCLGRETVVDTLCIHWF